MRVRPRTSGLNAKWPVLAIGCEHGHVSLVTCRVHTARAESGGQGSCGHGFFAGRPWWTAVLMVIAPRPARRASRRRPDRLAAACQSLTYSATGIAAIL